MKDLDIEKLERQNIYKVPEGFFDEMQQNVFQKITPHKTGKIIKLNWAYSAAAAIALLFGITFFINQNNKDAQTENQKITSVEMESKSTNTNVQSAQPKKEAVVAYQTLEKDLTNAVATNQKENTDLNTVNVSNKGINEKQDIVSANPNTEKQVDQILANFSSAELADLGKNTEQDVYLDLYN